MKPIYIFDLDGTLADVRHRRHYVTGPKKDFNAFNAACVDDKPIPHVVATLHLLQASGADIRIWSGRLVSGYTPWESATFDWLRETLGDDSYYALTQVRFRTGSDRYLPDEQLKQRWLGMLSPASLAQLRLGGVFDDRDKVVAMWRRNNIPCYQVAEGDF